MADRRWLEPKAEPGTHLTPLQWFRTFAKGILYALCVCSATPLFPAAPPAWSLNQPIYEVNLQMFSQSGTYKELEKRLPEIKAQGVGIIWLMPITTRGVLKAFNSPYCVKDYKGFHAPFGSAQDFRALVAAVHAHGLHLILDWVPNHSSWDNALIAEHPEFYKKDASGKIAQAYDWTDVAQLDYGNAGLRAWMIEAMRYWIVEYGVDGFRCDVAWGVPADFWAQARAELDKSKPVFMLAESNNVKDQDSFDSNYDWELMNVSQQTVLTDIAKGAKPASAIDVSLAFEKGYRADFRRMRFTSNHDEWNNFGTPFQRLGGGARTFAVLAATLPGKPLLYNGQEIGWNPADRATPIAWSDSGTYRDFYRRLLTLHQGNPAMHSGAFAKIKSGKDEAVYAFVRTSGADKVLIALNLTGNPVSVTLSGAAAAGNYRDLFSGGTVDRAEGGTVTLPAWGYQVLVSGPQTGLASPHRKSVRGDGAFIAFPGNMASGSTSVPAVLWGGSGIPDAVDFRGRLIPVPAPLRP